MPLNIATRENLWRERGGEVAYLNLQETPMTPNGDTKTADAPKTTEPQSAQPKTTEATPVQVNWLRSRCKKSQDGWHASRRPGAKLEKELNDMRETFGQFLGLKRRNFPVKVTKINFFIEIMEKIEGVMKKHREKHDALEKKLEHLRATRGISQKEYESFTTQLKRINARMIVEYKRMNAQSAIAAFAEGAKTAGGAPQEAVRYNELGELFYNRARFDNGAVEGLPDAQMNHEVGEDLQKAEDMLEEIKRSGRLHPTLGDIRRLLEGIKRRMLQ